MMYRCAPADRPALRNYMEGRGTARLETLRAKGMLTAHKVLFSRYVNSDSWDMLILLDFASPAAAAQWSTVEKSSPAGLDPEVLKLVTSIETYTMDVVQQRLSERPVAKPVYLVLPYNVTVTPEEYVKYVADYVQPQVLGWMEEGVLAGYRALQGRDTASRPWSSILLLEYKDDTSLGERAVTTAKVRMRLQHDPAWKAVSDKKHTIRTELPSIQADALD